MKNRINLFFLLLIICYYLWPYFQTNFRFFILFFSLIGFFLTINFKNFRFIFKNRFVFLFLLFFGFVPYLLSFYFQENNSLIYKILITYSLFFAGIPISNYILSLNDKKLLNFIFYFILFIFFVSMIQTITGLLTYPNASRELAGSLESNPDLIIFYGKLGIGGYGFIYSLMFFSLFVFKIQLEIFFRIPFLNYFLFIFQIFSFITLVLASYTFAVFFYVFGLLLILFIYKKYSINLILFLFPLFIILIPYKSIGSLFVSFSIFLDPYSTFFSNKFLDFGNFLLGNYGESLMSSFRLNLYLISFDSFLKNPIFGVLGFFGDNSLQIGNHSSWFDFSASFGIIMFMLLISLFFYSFSFDIKSGNNYRDMSFLKIIYILFFLLGFVNPILNSIEIGFIFLFVFSVSVHFNAKIKF